MNLIEENDDGSCDHQFMISTHFYASTTYILVVTTHSPNVTGSFSILAFGPNSITLKRSSEYMYYFVYNE
jgi:hypothetical protein